MIWKEYIKKYYQKNKKEIDKKHKKYYEENREELCKKHKKYYEENKEKLKETTKKYYEENKEKLKKTRKEYQKNRRKKDINFKLKQYVGNSIRQYMRNKIIVKNERTEKLIGYNILFLKKYLENQFNKNMNWDNYGSYWQIDHIIPQSLFDFTNENEVKKCWDLNNLRPLNKKDNNSKNNSLNIKLIEKYNIRDLLPI